MGAALTAMAISLALLAYPAYLGLKAYRLPSIYDITTDPIDPPRYDALARLRPRDANPVAYAGLYAAEQQRKAYPDVGPLATNATPQAAYDAALAVVNKRRWRVVDARAPQAGRREGHIEAVARTPIMGFRDDVVIRVRGGARRRAHRRALLLPLRLVRFRHQRLARARAARTRSKMPSARNDRSGRRRSPPPRSRRRARKTVQEVASSQAVAPLDRGRAVGRDHPARHQILEMREHRQARRLRSAADRARYRSRARASGYRPRLCSSRCRIDASRPCAMADVVLHEARRVAHDAAMAGQVDRLRTLRELLQRGHVIAHRTVRRRDDRRRPSHHVIAGEQQVALLERERHVVRGMAGRRDRLDGPARGR